MASVKAGRKNLLHQENNQPSKTTSPPAGGVKPQHRAPRKLHTVSSGKGQFFCWDLRQIGWSYRKRCLGCSGSITWWFLCQKNDIWHVDCHPNHLKKTISKRKAGSMLNLGTQSQGRPGIPTSSFCDFHCPWHEWTHPHGQYLPISWQTFSNHAAETSIFRQETQLHLTSPKSNWFRNQSPKNCWCLKQSFHLQNFMWPTCNMDQPELVDGWATHVKHIILIKLDHFPNVFRIKIPRTFETTGSFATNLGLRRKTSGATWVELLDVRFNDSPWIKAVTHLSVKQCVTYVFPASFKFFKNFRVLIRGSDYFFSLPYLSSHIDCFKSLKLDLLSDWRFFGLPAPGATANQLVPEVFIL